MKPEIDAKAFQLIDSFAKDLLALNDGKKIPTVWMSRVIGQLNKTTPGKAGRKRDNDEVREIVKQITLNIEEINLERTKQNSPANAKNRIANNLKVSRKKFDRILLEFTPVLNSLDSLDPETRQAYIEGMSDAIAEELLDELNETKWT